MKTRDKVMRLQRAGFSRSEASSITGVSEDVANRHWGIIGEVIPYPRSKIDNALKHAFRKVFGRDPLRDGQ